jgi:GNAT superfamily N-acetyltransferase
MHKSEHGLQRRSFPDNSNLYWIAFLATSPKAQGQGLAKALLARVRERAAAEGKIVALLTQTKENVAFYEKLGFVVKDTITGPVRDTTIQYWSMTWTPPAN